MEIVPFISSHVHRLVLQDAQVSFYDKFTPEYGRALELAGGGYTALVDGHPVACAGVIEQWHGRGLAWALLGNDSGPHFVRIVRGMKRALNLAQFRRVEAQVQADFGAGIRMAEMLGFEVESKMAKFTPEGRDAFMFVRIRP